MPAWTWDVSATLGEEYKPMANDVIRLVTTQLVVQFLLCIVDGENNPFFSGVFWLVLLYLVLGVMTYHLVVCKLVCVA
jgi:hypothetical protein